MAGTSPPANMLRGRARTARVKARRAAGRVKRAVLRRGRGPGGGGQLPTIGMVERFEYRQIEGWLVGEPQVFPVRVTLRVNDMDVASTWADAPSGRNTWAAARTFSFALDDLWDYCKRRDRVTVRVDGKPLPIAAKGIYKKPARDGAFSLADLSRKFADNYVFDQLGKLQLSKKYDTEWQASVLGLYRRVGELLRDKYGYEPFVMYGTLLGLLRERGFIGHDIDFDAAYVSRHTDGPRAAAELRDIALALIDAGFDVECKRTALHIHDASDPELRIDLFHLYFEDDELRFPFGVAGTTTVTTRQWTGIVPADLAGHRVFAPAALEAMVECIYGASWRTPIAGFNWDRARTGWADDGRLPHDYARVVYWENFYARHEVAAPSSFAEFLLGRGDLPAAVLDLGCGNGRDSLAFARAGRGTVGLDRSPRGIAQASAAAEAAELAGSASFLLGDVGDPATVSEAVKRARESAQGGPVLLYLRFLLHAVPEQTRTALLDAVHEAAEDGDVLAAEFRTPADNGRPKAYGRHPARQFLDAGAFTDALRAKYSFDVRFGEEASGVAPLGDEDPVLYRVVAVRRAPSDVPTSAQ